MNKFNLTKMNKFNLTNFLVENRLTTLGRLSEGVNQLEDKHHSDILKCYGFTIFEHPIEVGRTLLEFEGFPVFTISEIVGSDGVKELLIKVDRDGNQFTKELAKIMKTTPYEFKLDPFGKRQLIQFLERASSILANVKEPYPMRENFNDQGFESQPISEKEGMVEPTSEAEEDYSKYESVEELMKEIESSTNKAAMKHKMERVKKAYESIEAKASSLEEGEHASYIAPTKLREMRRGSKELRKMHERLMKEYDKKYTTKSKKM